MSTTMNAANRLLGILALFTVEEPAWTVEGAARQMRVSVSTAYRYFADLSKAGLLDPFPGGRYVLGPAIIEGDRKIRMTDPLIRVGKPAMQRLVARAGGTGVAILCRIYRRCVMCVHQEPSAMPEGNISYERGRPMPMFRGASSKAIYANLSWRSARWYFENYAAEIVAAGLGSDWETVKGNLRRMRREGVVVSHGEVDGGVVGIAAPVFGPSGNVIGSVTMAIRESEASPQSIANISALVQAASREIDTGLRVLSQAPNVSSDSSGRTFGSAEESRAADRRKTPVSENR
jgi:DNA-binding IclR family transcriptional regulator